MLNKASGDTLPQASKKSLISKRNSKTKSQFMTQASTHDDSYSSRQQPFVPLKDLLTRRHDERVKEYLNKMNGLTMDDIINTMRTTTTNNSPRT